MSIHIFKYIKSLKKKHELLILILKKMLFCHLMSFYFSKYLLIVFLIFLYFFFFCFFQFSENILICFVNVLYVEMTMRLRSHFESLCCLSRERMRRHIHFIIVLQTTKLKRTRMSEKKVIYCFIRPYWFRKQTVE